MTGIIEGGKGLLGIETEAEKAAKRAGKVQAEGQEAGIAEQRRQFDVTQASFQPFQATGVDALEQQRILLGLGGTDPNAALSADLQSQIEALQGESSAFDQLPSRTTGVPGLIGSVISQLGIREAKKTENQAELAKLQTQLSEIPEFTPGTNAEQQQAAFAALDQSPGQQFLRDRAQKNLLRNSSAIGGLGGGNVRSALVQQGVGFAQQDLQNQFGRLGQLAGQGLSATTNVGQFGATAAGNIQQGLIGGSQARASGILGAQQARAGAQEQGTELGLAFFSDPKLKTNRQIIGNKNGYNIWSWTWNELAKELGLFGNDKGVMADEVKAKNPEAIGTRNGYMTVNYSMIGV